MNVRMNQWFALLLVVLLCATAHAQEKLQKVKIASGGHIVHFLPLDLAVALGYFKDEGLEPEITYLKGGTATAQALISKQVDFGTNSIDHAFKAAAQGKDDLRMVVLMNQTPGMVLVVDSKHKDKVKSISDLKGMRLGVTSKGSATNMVLAFLLSKNGVSPNDVTVVKAGSSTFPPALKNGDIDGGIALEPFASMMVEQGDAYVLQRLITAKDSQQAFGGPYNLAGIVTRQDVIDSNPKQVQKVVNVIVRVLKWMQNHTEEEIADALSSEVVGSDNARYVRTLKLLKEFYSPNGRISTEGADNVLAAMKASGVLPEGLQQEQDVFLTNRFVAKVISLGVSMSSEQVSDGLDFQSSGYTWARILGTLLICVAGIVIILWIRTRRKSMN
jgi:sulfonate transport system substrate-binding protein